MLAFPLLLLSLRCFPNDASCLGAGGGLPKANCGWKAGGRGAARKAWKLYRSGSCWLLIGPRRPDGLNARAHPVSEYFAASGRISDERYAFAVGAMKAYVGKDSRLVICLMQSLSVQDLLNVGSVSGREGLRRTIPRAEKNARPGRYDCACGDVVGFSASDEVEFEVDGGADVSGGG